MIRIPKPRTPRQRESTIALINIVFLMLIFFLIAGTLAPPMDPQVRLISTVHADPAEPPQALFIAADGTIRARGQATTVPDFLSAMAGNGQDGEVRIAADRELPATQLVEVIGQLRGAGVARVSVITERATQ